ncbi:MAG TPA: carbohydrate kinase family protein [Terriglobales bacterium]|nr:carbohydrate kinase family protein [Terriglobales bacterium]
MDVVVVGELNADLVLTGLTSLPAYGEVRLAKDMRFALGSSSAIFACNLARLGMEVGFVGKLGADETGDFLLQSLRDRGVDTSQIVRSPAGRTGICVVMSFPHEYAMASFPGIRETFCLEEVNLDYVKTARHMHMSSFYLQTALRPGCHKLFYLAKEAGLTTSLDPDVDPSSKWNGEMREVLPYVDIFLPNEQEAARISGETDPADALNSLCRLSRTVVIKRGAKGVLTKCGERKVEVPGFSVRPVDTTGAGDSFNAGFVFQFIQGAPLAECVAWGNACGALSTRALGGTEGFPTRTEVEQFFSERGEELEKIRRAFA